MHRAGRRPCISTTLPKDFLNQTVLFAVKAIAPDDVTAVGHLLDSDNQRTLTMIQHWDGTQWSVVPSPTPARAQQLFGAFALPGTTDVWVVGGWSIPGIDAEFGLLQLPKTLVLFSSGG